MFYIKNFVILLLFAAVVSARRSRRAEAHDPCPPAEGCNTGKYRLPDPTNCKKFWLCCSGSKGQRYRCPAGKSFDPNKSSTAEGICTGPARGCFNDLGKIPPRQGIKKKGLQYHFILLL